MAYFEKFVKDLWIVGITNFLMTLRNILLLPIITKLLGVESYGIWTQLSVTLSLVAPLVVLRLPDALIRFLAGEKDTKKIQGDVWSVFLIVLTLSFCVVCIFAIFHEPIGRFLRVPPLFLPLLGLTIALDALVIFFINIFRVFQQLGTYSLFLIGIGTAEIVFMGLSIALGFNLLGIVLVALSVRAVTLLLLIFCIARKIGVALPSFSRLKKYLSFSLPLVVSSTSYWAVQSSDRYFIGFFLGITAVGYYSPAYTFGNMIQLFVIPFALVLPTIVSKLFDEHRTDQIKKYLAYSLKYFLLSAIPFTCLVSALSPQLLSIFATKEVADRASFVTPFIAVSLSLYGIYTIYLQILFLQKRTKMIGTIWLFTALFSFGSNLLLIPKFGIWGAATTTLLSYLFPVFAVWFYTRSMTFPVDFLSIGKSILASLLIAGIIFQLHPEGIIQTAIAFILAGLVYGILLFVLRVFRKEEIEFMKKVLPFIPRH